MPFGHTSGICLCAAGGLGARMRCLLDVGLVFCTRWTWVPAIAGASQKLMLQAVGRAASRLAFARRSTGSGGAGFFEGDASVEGVAAYFAFAK
ncbi:MAG: hypothetical protein IJ268_12745, partial [Proteobacteria bacterium]|nr:hypothetical protein [Pseudomonadota bacterium]